jgi:hypothetical protein
MGDTEKEIYAARRFHRKASVGLFALLLALAGLAGGLYALHMIAAPLAVIGDRVHVSCPHPECKMPHLGVDQHDLPAGAGSGGLVVVYLLLCAGVVVYVLDEKP